MQDILRIATRRSPLALWQANYVREQLTLLYPTLKIDIVGIVTSGDKLLNVSLSKSGGKGLFVKELEQALLENNADIAVHSMKDVPMALSEDLMIAAIGERADPRDVFISNHYKDWRSLPAQARIGTSSLRRQTQMQQLRADLTYFPLRGNVDTRLAKLDNGNYDAIVLAAAGMKRLAHLSRIRSYFSIEELLPAAGQGAIGIECRINDDKVKELVAPLNHSITAACVNAERAVGYYLKADCSVPVAAYAMITSEDPLTLALKGFVASSDGKQILTANASGLMKDAHSVGVTVANALLDQGANALLIHTP